MVCSALITNISVVLADWKKSAEDKLAECGFADLELEESLENIIRNQSESYPVNTWIVCLAESDSIYRIKSRPEFGEMDRSTISPILKFNMSVYSVATSELTERGGKCPDLYEKKAQNIVNEVYQRTINSQQLDSVTEELITRLDEAKLHWLLIVVLANNSGSVHTRSSDYSNLTPVRSANSSTKSFIQVFLSK